MNTVVERAISSKADDIEISLEFRLEEFPCFVSANITMLQAFECINSGLLHNKPVRQVKLYTVTGEEGNSISLVYDIAAAKSGSNPWSMI